MKAADTPVVDLAGARLARKLPSAKGGRRADALGFGTALVSFHTWQHGKAARGVMDGTASKSACADEESETSVADEPPMDPLYRSLFTQMNLLMASTETPEQAASSAGAAPCAQSAAQPTAATARRGSKAEPESQPAMTLSDILLGDDEPEVAPPTTSALHAVAHAATADDTSAIEAGSESQPPSAQTQQLPAPAIAPHGGAVPTAQSGPGHQPAGQVALAVRHALPGLVQPDPLSAGSTVKHLSFRLHPEDLGTVSITLRLQQGKLEVSVAPEKATTRQLLEATADVLSSSLATVDPAFATVDVVVADKPSADVADRPPQGGSGSGQMAQSFSQQQREGRAGHEAQRPHAQPVLKDVENDAQQTTGRPAGRTGRAGAVYL